MPVYVDLRITQHRLLNDLASLQCGAPDQERNSFGEFGEEQAFFCGTVAAADYSHMFAFVEGAIAGRAEMNPGPDVVTFAGHMQAAVAAARREQQRLRAVFITVAVLMQ